MPSVGQQFREQRLRLGLKLEEISARSRISLKTLQAIESDDLASLSSSFLYKSFARQFAEHRKLDYKALAEAVESAAVTMPKPLMPGEGGLGKTNLAPIRMKGRERSFRWLYSVASLGFMLVACSSLYGVWQTAKSSWIAELTGLVHAPTSSDRAKSAAGGPAGLPVTSRNLSHSSTAVPVQAPGHKRLPSSANHVTENQTLVSAEEPKPDPSTQSSQAPAADQEPSRFRVELSALESSWVSIVEDGKQTFSGVLDPEQTKVLEGHDNARIRTGNAGGISYVFNGKSLGPLGPRGQVRTVVFTKSNYEVVDASAPVALTHYPSISE